MRKMLLTLALIAAPAMAVAQQPARQAAQTPAAHDSTKAKAKRTSHHRKRTGAMAHDSTKAKSGRTTTQDSTKKP